MHFESKRPGHWTDDQLIAYLYGIGSDDHHLSSCQECQSRVLQLQARQEESRSEDVDIDLLAAQRRRIYARLTAPTHWSAHWQVRRWVSVAAMTLVFGGGALFYQEHEQQRAVNSRLSDAQLAQDVSLLAQNSEDMPAGPLEALFDE